MGVHVEWGTATETRAAVLPYRDAKQFMDWKPEKKDRRPVLCIEYGDDLLLIDGTAVELDHLADRIKAVTRAFLKA